MPNEVLEVPPDRPGGTRRASRSSRRPVRRRDRGGARALRTRRRTHGLAGTIGMTVLGAFVPGSGYLYAGRRWLGGLVLGVWLLGIAGLAWYFGRDLKTSFDVVFNPTLTRVVAAALGVLLLAWVFVVFTSHRLVRPRSRPRWHTVVGYAAVAVVVVAGAAPVLRAAQYALVTADAVESVLKEDVKSATTPDASEDDPWAGQDRVNILLLGGDGGEGRTGVRTDTVILASIDTVSGKTVTFSLPRNMMYAQFPEDSPLHDVYPDGYQTGQGDPGFDMLNAIYSQVPELHPGILGESDNEGADAVKLAVEGSLGLPVDYYLLVNLEGFKSVVDAMGGITVNINKPVAINGNTDLGIPPTGYLDPGPDQHLDGFHALWFARGRYGSDDYERMDRQRCAIDALVDAADPATLLTRYIDIIKAGQEVLYTDIPRKLGSAFVDLLLRVKDGKFRSVVFRSSDQFFSGDPDYDYVRDIVQKAIDPPKRKPGTAKVRRAEDPVDVCAYNPDADDLSASD
jgi:polyisoprenyl-teichoic acid--peptidoglycan teichoic acid transferase